MNILNLRRVALSTVVLILMRAIANSRSLRPGSSGSATGARARILSPAPGTSSPDLTVTVLSRVRVALEALPGFGGMWVSDDNRLAVGLVGQLSASALVGMRRSCPLTSPSKWSWHRPVHPTPPPRSRPWWGRRTSGPTGRENLCRQ
jgi:hypothetical protein